MEKLFFKKMYVNFTIGVILIYFVVAGTLISNVIEEYLPVMFAGVLFLVSTKRFVFQFKKIISKNATLILAIEFLLDLIAIGLLIYLNENISIFIGIVIYLRGVSYLMINYIATRKIKLLQYILNILFVTLGAFLMFSTLLNDENLLLIFSSIIGLFGLAYILYGVLQFRKKDEKKRIAEETIKKQEKVEKLEEKKQEKTNKFEEKKLEKIEKIEEKKQEKIDDIESKIEKVKKETADLNDKKTQAKPLDGSLEAMTIPQLKIVGEAKGLTGLSNLNKSEIIKKIRDAK